MPLTRRPRSDTPSGLDGDEDRTSERSVARHRQRLRTTPGPRKATALPPARRPQARARDRQPPSLLVAAGAFVVVRAGETAARRPAREGASRGGGAGHEIRSRARIVRAFNDRQTTGRVHEDHSLGPARMVRIGAHRARTSRRASHDHGRAGCARAGLFCASPQQQAFLDQLERDTFKFFWDATPSGTGLTPDRSPGSDVQRGSRRLRADVVPGRGRARVRHPGRGSGADPDHARDPVACAPGPGREGVAGYKGLFYHFLDGAGRPRRQSELSTIDTALLMAGVLSSQAYFDREDETERSIRLVSDRLYRRVDWAWASSRRHRPLLSMGWSPEEGFIDVDWRGYNEGMLLYVLALGSPTHPIDPQAWEEWTRSYPWEGAHGPAHVTFGPLFGHQYSHVWIDFRGIQDWYMRSKGSDYFANSVRATYANRAYCIANPGRWKGYGELVWGLTASDGPLDGASRARVDGAVPRLLGARGGPGRRSRRRDDRAHGGRRLRRRSRRRWPSRRSCTSVTASGTGCTDSMGSRTPSTCPIRASPGRGRLVRRSVPRRSTRDRSC